MRRTGRIVRRALLAAGALVLLVFLVMVTLNALWYGQIVRELDEIRAQGQPVTVKDLIQPKVPDEDNAALLYARAIDLLPEGDSAEWQVVCDFLSEEKRRQDPQLWQEVSAVPERYSRVISLMESAVVKPECQFKTDWNMPALITQDASGRRRLSQLLACASLLSARDGRMDQVVRYTKLGIGLSRSFDDEPALTNQLVAIAVLSINSQTMRQVLADGDLSEEQTTSLLDAVSSVNLSSAHERALAAERTRVLCWMNTYYRSVAYMPLLADRDILTMDTSRQALGRPTADVLGLRGFERMQWKVWEELYARCAHTGDSSAWLSFMRGQVEGVTKPYRETVSQGLLERSRDLPSYAVASRCMAGVQPRFHASRFRAQTRLAMDRTLLLLLVYKARHGDYPECLDGLGPLGDVPNDPYSGADFGYKRLVKGFLLYSIGPDLRDDGGAKAAKDASEPSDGGDVVLRWE